MDAYSPLLEKIRIPQPSFQKLAVISIFEKLRSAPPHLGPDSYPGTEAITQCLHSASPAVVDQSVRELCRLVRDSKLDLSRGLLELQSALEATASRFVNLFVRGLGYLVRLGFQNNPHSFQFQASETHPFVMILSSRKEVQAELVRQVLIFLAECKQCGMVEVCRFLTPFLNSAIVRMSSLVSLTSFLRDLLSSIASLCCSLPREAIPITKLLIGRIKYFPCKNEDDYTEIFYLVECIVDAYSVVLRQLVGNGLLVHEAQLCSVELLDALFSLHNDLLKPAGSVEYILEVSRRLLVVQKELGLSFLPELSSAISFIFIILVHSELEHEQLSALKLLCFILKWKNDSGKDVHRSSCLINEELLFIFPVINLVYSPTKSVKQAAIDLLSVLRKLSINLLAAPRTEVSTEKKHPSISTSAHIAVRLLQSLWLQDQSSLPGVFYLNFASGIESSVDKHNKAKPWTSMLSEYMQRVISRRKSSQSISESHESLHTEMPLLLSGIACVLLMHQSLGHSAGDLLAICNKMDPKLGVPLMLVILFYNHIYSDNKNVVSHGMQLKLMGMLPSLASHSAMLPLVVQTILPMLQKDAKSVLYATAIRLICKTWECNDRVFGSLQGVLHANKFTEFASDREIYISMALSICDVCRKDPDRGVDLILSVEACIKHQDSFIQSLGLESLAHLCEADVVDFYTAWDVIAKQLNYSGNATVAFSLCHLLRWGAMDAESYTEAAIGVVELLWEIGTSVTVGHGWSKARASAFEALTHYEVGQFQGSLLDFNERNLQFLTSETDLEVLRALEAFEVKIINHEHITRRRVVKQKRLPKSKIEKLLDVFPQVMFASGNGRRARELPGAALFCLSFTLKGLNMPGASEALQDVLDKYKNAVVEIADSLQLSRNVLIALLALQSWKPFMQRWIRARIMLLDTKVHSAVLDKTSNAAKEILKCLIEIAERSPPRSAENIALAIGALCSVLPLSDHAIKSTASKFLLSWLFQHEHEYRQWSAAISLGLISSFLHVTDRKQKVEYINALLEVLSVSKSTLVKGACGVGLGFSCQDLLTKSDAEDNFHLSKGALRMEEIDLLKKIIGSLFKLICPLTQSSSDVLINAFSWLQLGSDDFDSNITPKFLGQCSDDFEEDVWGVAGLILGLGSSVGAIYRAGFYDAVLNLKTLLFSWIPNLNPSIPFLTTSAKSELLFSVGACLAAPIVMAFCHRVELMDGTDIDQLVGCYKHLISELVSVQKFSTLHQSLLMASCIGAGSLLGTILNGSLHSLKVEHVKDLLALFRKSYSDPNPPLIHLGATIGAVNAFGAGAGTLVQDHPSFSSHATNNQKESSYINGPLLSSPALEPDLTSLVQEIFLVAQNPDADQLQQYAAWAASFLRHSLQLQEHYNEATTVSGAGTKNVSHIFSEDSTVLKLSLWLSHLKHPGTGNISHVNTISMVLRCLEHAPRLPLLDWGAIIRRFMRYESEVAELLSQDVTFKKGHLREECLLFSLSHAYQFDHLLIFLDELCDFARMRTLEPTLQSCILVHLADLTKIFSSSRLVKLFNDVACFLSWLVSSGLYSPEQKSSLRFSCWRGLNQCLNESSLDTQSYTSEIENCMKVLFDLLPQFPSAGSRELYQANIIEEWSEAVRCLGKSEQGWLLDLLQISEVNLIEANGQQLESVKKIQVKSRLVQTGSVPFSELGKLKAYMLNCRCEVIWDALLGVTETLHYADGSVKRQWLVNAMEISCVSKFPSTALQFIGLLCGSCCRYMPVLVVDQMTVLSDLPVTLTSLLSDSNWAVVAESVVSHLWSLTLRVYNLAKHTADDYPPNQLPIDSSEYDKAAFLFQVLHHSCISLKNYLPPEKLLQLANITIH
nr:protein RST1 isoform X1 [Ipomoea batatas]